jgi:Na+-driven multidrug efflux pump
MANAMILIRILNIEGVALAYLIANTIGAIIVIIKINNPTELTLKLLKVKRDVITI